MLLRILSLCISSCWIVSSKGFTATTPGVRFGSGDSHGWVKTKSRSKVAVQATSEDDGTVDDTEELFQDLFQEQRQSIFENAIPSIPSSGSRPPSKSDVYTSNELADLWELHQQLSNVDVSKERSRSPEDDLQDAKVPSLHDLVLETVAQVDAGDKDNNAGEDSDMESSSSSRDLSWLTDEIVTRAKGAQAIASDVDGTLLGSDQTVHPRTKNAIRQAVQAMYSPLHPLKWFFLATGKTRKGALDSLGPEIAALVQDCPGVFIQGLYCVYQGKVIYEQRLSNEAIVACEALVAETRTSVIAYDGDNLYTTDLTQTVRDLHEIYGEPLSKEVSSLADHELHKILICDNDVERLNQEVRPKLEALASQYDATVTQAIPTMLEFLPAGCSKGLGVKKLCEALGISSPSTDLVALGDAENDIGMLQMAALGIVMGNGSPIAKEAADVVLDETASEGGAGGAMEVILRQLQ